MIMGAERAEAQPDGESGWGGRVEAVSLAAESPESFNVEAEEAASEEPRRRILATALVLLSLGWLGVCGYALSQAWPGAGLATWTGWVATISVPLILLSLIWLIFGRSSRRETELFTRSVAEMRRESEALESVLGIVAMRLQESRAALSDETARLMSLGDEASDRLGRVTHYLARESAELDRKAQALDLAATSARVDIGVLMSDLPRAEEQARAVAEAMRQAGLAAHEQAAVLDGQLAALTARSREADEAAGGSAQRLGAQVARIESGAEAAAQRMDAAAAQMNAAVDGALARAADAIEQARTGLEAQGQAMLSMVEQSRAVFEHAGADATRLLAERLEQVGGTLERLSGQLAAQQAATSTLVSGLSEHVAEVDRQIGQLGEAGDAQSERLSQSLAALREVTSTLQRELDMGQACSGALIDRVHEMAGAIDQVSGKLREQLPAALAAAEAQAGQTAAAAQAAVPSVEAIQAAAALAAESLVESEAGIVRQREHLEALLERVREGTAQAEERLHALGITVEETDETANRLVRETGPHLVDALVRVRETATQAATYAREAIARAIPESAAALADASRDAVSRAISDPVEDQLAELAGAAQRAMAVARQASERLTRQLLVMSETAAAVEDRIAEDQAKREEQAAENLTRRVALLIEALNSTAIDVSKVLSNEVADSAWAAYLKGDRGVFTRRAVRLLDSGEAREIQRHYEAESDFRDQVNRYVHDFEAMLRRVLAERDNATLGVTLLSSDMGKLYVALAQAIDRLRR